MSWERWSAVDEYVTGLLVGEDPVLDAALRESEQAGLPPIAVSPSQGKLLSLVARIHGARRILELGTLGGYSTIWLARALPEDGRLVSLELKEDYAQVAAANIARSGLAERVEIRVGPALESLQELRAEGGEPFDMVFIDADKRSTPEYFTEVLELVRPGAVILTDNVVRDGALIDMDDRDPHIVGMRRFHELLSEEPHVSATTIQTVGVKGYDGFTLALVNPA
jgi:predicted O-methyltransferase YrrM